MDSKAFKKRDKVRQSLLISELIVRLREFFLGIVLLTSYAVSCATGHNTRIFFSFRVQWEHFEMKAAEQSFHWCL